MTRSIVCASRPALAVLVALCLLAGIAAADTLYLKNGKTFVGSLVSDREGVVRFKTAGGVLEFPKDQVDRIEEGATPADEYKRRRGEIEDDDIESLLQLTRWCREKRLFSQRKKLLKALQKLSPDHPGVRKESGQAWRDGKWVKADDVTYEPVKPGTATEIKETRGKIAMPSGWERKDAAKSATATGPDHYATPPVLKVEVTSPTEPKQSFPERDGWEAPVAASAGGLTGLRSRRDYVESLIGRVEWLAVLTGPEKSVVIRLNCLECEAEEYVAAFGIAIDSLEFAAPAADYVNQHYHYQLNLPTGNWEGGEDEEHDLVMVHRGLDALEFALLMIVTGNPGEEYDGVKELYNGLIAQMKSDGDIEKEEEITLSGQKGTFVQGTYLEDGIPVRSVACLVEYQKRLYCIHFQNHEYGGEKTGHALKTVMDTFRFTK